MAPRLAITVAAISVAAFLLTPVGGAATALRPPVTWLKGDGNYTKASRAPQSIDRVVVHVTEGQFWGAVSWLKNPRAHASSHFVVSRAGKIVQLVHTSDIAWHAGNWRTNIESVGIEHEGFTYGPDGFTDAQYRNSARLTAWLVRRALMPVNRRTIIGHSEVPGPGGRKGGASGHTDPGPRWNWTRYLTLVRSYAGVEKPRVLPLVPAGALRGIVPWRAKTAGGIRRVEFSIDGRVVWVDDRAPFAYRGGGALNTTKLANGRHVLQVHGIVGPGRYDIARAAIIVDNRAFRLTSAGARPWKKVRGTLTLRSRVWGAPAKQVSFRVDGRVRSIDRKAPFTFSWTTKDSKDGKHLLELVATALDGRVTRRRIPVVVANRAVAPLPKPQPKPPKPKPAPAPTPLRIVSQTVANGQIVTGLVLWRVEPSLAATVEFLVDGVVRGADVAAPYTFGWNASAETPGEHVLTARAKSTNGKTADATVTVTVPAPASGTEAP